MEGIAKGGIMNEHYETLKALSMSAEDKVEIDPDVLRWAIERIKRLSKEIEQKDYELNKWQHHGVTTLG